MITLEQLRAVNAASPYNRAAGFDLIAAGDGTAELAVPAKPDLLQHSGVLHAGVLGALIDTACGYAAATIAGPVLASHYNVHCYRTGRGDRFIARARVVKSGRRQIFVTSEVHAREGERETLIAGGDAIFIPVE